MKFKQILSFSFAALILMNSISAKEVIETKNTTKKEPLKEETVTTKHSIKIEGTEIPYQAIAGTIVLKDNEDKDKGSFFYTAYLKDDVENLSTRPITYCFNGGPGSSSVWLHLGVFGPKKVIISDNGSIEPPYGLEVNDYSILDVTDLVFIDPISTGFSKPAPGEDAKQFHGVDEDIKSVAEFVRMFTTKYNRWESPKYLAGESYGTTRAVGLASELHDEYFLYVNGVILVSSVLDFQTLTGFGRGNDLPYVLYLPSYTATAFYHKKLSVDLQKDFNSALKEASDFAINEYSVALMKGDTLGSEEKERIVKKLSYYTGLPVNYIKRADMRVNAFQFRKELLSDQQRDVGRFDSRYTGIEANQLGEIAQNDPSAEAVFGAFTATFNHYIRTDLEWKDESRYNILTNVFPWNFGRATNEYLNLTKSLRQVLTKNPKMQIFVANGYYDLATPFFATEYTFNHLNLDKSIRENIQMEYYDAGHMMYIHQPSLVKLNSDIKKFIRNTFSEKTR